MVDFQYKDSYGYADLLHIMELLRSPGGCPWDRAQDHASLRRNLLEEACEAAEAIDCDDKSALCEELGDVLLQVVFHAELERETGGFTMDDVVDGICKKLVYRHPHVFGTLQADTNEDLSRWETLKRKEKGQASTADAVDAVARTLPGLWRAEKMLQKASGAGFDWSSADGAVKKLEEETGELRRAVLSGDAVGAHGVQEELGDVLFSAARIAQEQSIDPEAALHGACDKFSRRFRAVEELAGGTPLNRRSEEELISLWNRAKEREKS